MHGVTPPLLHPWGAGAGPVSRCAPQTRLACTALVFAACMVAPWHEAAGLAAALLLAGLWVALCGTAVSMLLHWCTVGVVMCAPVMILTPWVATPGCGEPSWIERLGVTAVIALKGITALLVCAAGASTLGLPELPEALAGLPLPRWLTVVTGLILFQSMTLLAETERMMQAMRLRGVTHGVIPSVRVALSLPVVWTLRILHRAERTAAAMTLRGFDTRAFAHLARTLRPCDWAALAGAGAAVVLAAALWWGHGI
jgi:energy-coupling factor transporter transmembrane protein EcfT